MQRISSLLNSLLRRLDMLVELIIYLEKMVITYELCIH
jgi:hypothetical protein